MLLCAGAVQRGRAKGGRLEYRTSIRGAVPLSVPAIDSPEVLELGFHQALDWWLEPGSCPEVGSSQEVGSYPETG